MRSDSYNRTSLENVPSPRSAPSVERSKPDSSSIYPSAESPGSIEGITSTWTSSKTTEADGVTQLAPPKPERIPGPGKVAGSLEPPGPTSVQQGSVPGKSGGLGGPPPSDGRFFSNPLNLRTITTGTGDGYRSPGPPSRLDTISPLHHTYRDRLMVGDGLTVPGLNQSLSEMATERFRPPHAPQQVATQPPNDPGLGTEHRYGQLPPPSDSSVLPAELMAYNDLMVDIGTARYLGKEMREPGPSPFAHPPMSTNSGRDASGSGLSTNGYQRQGFPHSAMHEPPQTVLPFGYPQQGQPYCGVGHPSAQQTHVNYGGQRPTGGIMDYR